MARVVVEKLKYNGRGVMNQTSMPSETHSVSFNESEVISFDNTSRKTSFTSFTSDCFFRCCQTPPNERSMSSWCLYLAICLFIFSCSVIIATLLFSRSAVVAMLR